MDSTPLTGTPRHIRGLEIEMQDRNNIVNTLMDMLGPDGSRELAEALFDELRADGRIYWDDARGLVISNDIDLIAEAAKLA